MSSRSSGNGRQPVIIVGGPTASGKSALAVGLAESLGGVVINADAMQLYTDLPILCAQPDAAERARAPHRLFGILAADDPGSVGRWRELALQAVAEARAADRPAIVVGGTGLYLRALTDGIDNIPQVPASIRSEVEARYDAIGGDAFKAALAKDDPVVAARLAPGDRQRLVRAASVLEATGRPLSAWQTVDKTSSPDDLNTRMFVLAPSREALYAACDRRFRAMIELGALEEAREFLARGLDAGLPLMKAVGLRELGRHLAGEITLDAAIELGSRSTRRYAKRQYTWFRHQSGQAETYNEQYSESLQTRIFKKVRQFC